METHEILNILFGYLLGSIPFGWILAKLHDDVDLRNTGSGGIGATNAMRTGGLKMGLAVLALDLSKAALSAYLWGNWAGLAAIVGHCYPIWLKFHGGKGMAPLVGLALVAMPILFAVGFPIWLLVILTTRLSSLATLSTMMFAPAIIFLLYGIVNWAIVSGMVLVVWRHRANIARLISGTESKIKFRKQN